MNNGRTNMTVIKRWLYGVLTLVGVAAILVIPLLGVACTRQSPSVTAISTVQPTSVPSATTSPASTSETSLTQSDALILTLAPGVEMSFVRVPAGEFTMGSSDSDRNAQINEKPQHKVILDEYLIGKYEVTVAQFRAFVQATGYQPDSRTLTTGRDDHPVTWVSWNDAVAFCQWASEVTGREVRLPTEAEWEKAARGTDGRIYPWGNEPVDNSRANCSGKIGGTTPVGQYPSGASPYGALDMAGNASEWVNDRYREGYYSTSPSNNPSGPSSSDYGVLRGGSWFDGTFHVRTAHRYVITLDDRYMSYGFRCALSPRK